MPKFSDTATYFEIKATRTRSAELRERFAEAGRFYRELSRITLTFPPGYKFAGSDRPTSSRWTVRANECRSMAEVMPHDRRRAMLLQLAESCDRLAQSPPEHSRPSSI